MLSNKISYVHIERANMERGIQFQHFLFVRFGFGLLVCFIGCLSFDKGTQAANYLHHKNKWLFLAHRFDETIFALAKTAILSLVKSTWSVR